jgi:hypothetical protein
LDFTIGDIVDVQDERGAPPVRVVIQSFANSPSGATAWVRTLVPAVTPAPRNDDAVLLALAAKFQGSPDRPPEIGFEREVMSDSSDEDDGDEPIGETQPAQTLPSYDPLRGVAPTPMPAVAASTVAPNMFAAPAAPSASIPMPAEEQSTADNGIMGLIGLTSSEAWERVNEPLKTYLEANELALGERESTVFVRLLRMVVSVKDHSPSS